MPLGLPDMASLLDDFFPQAAPTVSMPVDVEENPQAYQVRVELPGVRKADLQVQAHEGWLEISAKRQIKGAQGECSQSLSRRLRLPEQVQQDSISAQLQDGILTLTLPKPPQAQPKTIPIE
jgi:HSP20 family protein